MAEKQWMIYTKRAEFDRIAARFSVSPVTARIIINRGVPEEEIGTYLNGTLSDLYSPHLMKDMDKGADILLRKIAEGKKIRVIGDYDIDGICSTFILITALKKIGADVSYDIPDRIKDGYGLNAGIIEKARSEGTDTIVTCDNGIGAGQEIEDAERSGMTVVVTDHHEVYKNADGSDNIPKAHAVIDPKQQACAYPFPEICGAVVALKLVQVLYERKGIPDAWRELLPFAAIATVGDVVRLQSENRIIVKYGLKEIPDTKNTGLLKLIERCELNAASISAYQIGFVIGPCLNAGGRLESAKVALRMLLEQDPEKAAVLAGHLKELNDERKEMTADGFLEAEKQVNEKYASDKILVVFLPECHESVAGIIAGRLREAFYRPSIVLTNSSSEEYLKGSGRSIEGYHMFKALEEVSDLFIRYGGHPMAAGMTLERKNEDILRKRLNENAVLSEENLREKLWIDAAVPFSFLSEPFIRELSLLEPYGQGNEKPVFARKDIRIESLRILGRERNVVKLMLRSPEGTPMEGIIFTDGETFLNEQNGRKKFDILYYPSVNEYMGRNTIQAVIKGWKFI